MALGVCADGILGVRMLLSAANGVCAFKGGQNCGIYTIVGAIIALASVVDSIFSFLVGQGLDKFVMFFLRKLTRRVCSQAGTGI